MLWWILLVAVASVVYLMLRIAKRIDGIEDDTAYIYEDQPRGSYGAKFWNILSGRGDG